MLAVLEKPEIRRRALPISVSAYHIMFEKGMAPDRAELIRGVIVEKMPKSPLHSRITSIIHRELFIRLPDFWVRKEDPLTLLDSEPEPDVSVVPGRAEDYASHPTTAHLVVEVAVTSEELDREKIAIYAEAGVQEYWLVLAHERAVEIHTSPKDGHWTSMRRVDVTEVLEPAVLPGVRIILADLFPV
jgi:Uma2 family endonuclease